MSMKIVFVADCYDHNQYYTGHSHSFEKNLVGCIPAIVPAIQGESVKNLAERLLHQINAHDWCFSENISSVEDSEIMKLILDELGEDIDSDNPFTEDWMYYGYLHFYKEDS